MSLFSERIKWLREKSAYNQKEVAEKVGMSQQGYSNIENGRREPNLEVLAKLPGIFGESLDFMLGITDHISKIEKIDKRIGEYIQRIQSRYEELANLIDLVNENINREFYEVKVTQFKSSVESLVADFYDMRDVYLKEMENIPMLSEQSRETLQRLQAITTTEDLLKVRTRDLNKE